MEEIYRKKRVFQIAKEFNITYDEIIGFLCRLGMEDVSVNSPVEIDIYDKIFIEFSKDKEALDRFRKDQARKNIQNTIRSKDADDTKIKSDHPQIPTPKKPTSDIREEMVPLGDKLIKEKLILQEEKKNTNKTPNPKRWIKLGSKEADEILGKYIKPKLTEPPTPKITAPDIREEMVPLGDKLIKEKLILQEEKKKTNKKTNPKKWIKLGSKEADEILGKYIKPNPPDPKTDIDDTKPVLVTKHNHIIVDTTKSEYEAVLNSLQDDLEEAIKQNDLPKRVYNNSNDKILFKQNWGNFKKILDREHILILYHFTDKKNIRSIISNGGLYSWYFCSENNISIPAQGGNGLSMNLDKRYNLQDYVHLCFNKNQPMCYVAKKEGRLTDVVHLEISPDVIFFRDTLFSNENATANSVSIGGNIDDFNKIDFAIANSGKWQDEHEKKLVQAEVLIKTHIPIRFIKNI